MLSKLKEIFKINKINPKATISKKDLELYNKNRPKNTKDTFCFAPSVNLYFSWEGKVIACCYNQKYELGNYPEQSIREIWDGQPARELRESLHNYDLSKGCESCSIEIQHGRYQSVNALRFDEYQTNDFPKMMEFQLTNTCNLQCVMCSGFLSSSIRKHRDNLPEIPMKFDSNFVDQLVEFLPNLEYTMFSGGEPFLIPIYYDIWNKLAELNPNCSITVITNGTILNNRVKALLEKNNFSITISVDSPIKENYENIRIGASFDRVVDNAEFFSQYCKKKGTIFNLNFCPMISNWRELPQFIELCNSLNASVYFSIVYNPWKLSLSKLSKNELELINERIEDEIQERNLPLNDNLKKLRQLLLKFKKWGIANGNPIELPKVSLENFRSLLIQKTLQFEKQSDENIRIVNKRIEESLELISIKGAHINLGFPYEELRKATPEALFNTLLNNTAEKLTEDLIAAYELYYSEKNRIV